jgi:hypothetical protein
MNNNNPYESFWKICLSDNLSTYDPYDIWKTGLGLKTKNLYNKNRMAGILPAVVLTTLDQFTNNNARAFYKSQEFPVVRALAAASLLNNYQVNKQPNFLSGAKKHLDWLVSNYSSGYSGYCWGANMPWASRTKEFNINTPFITNTPYVLEALIQYYQITNEDIYLPVIRSVYDFISKDLIKLVDNETTLCLSYAPYQQARPIINANAYALYSLSLLHSFLPDQSNMITKDIARLYNYIIANQRPDGSWLYYGDNKNRNFIDCFHSCFILKNLIKSSKYVSLPADSLPAIVKGYCYLKDNFYDKNKSLFKRFTKADKPGLVKFDLYDNAEMLNLSWLLNDFTTFRSLEENICRYFVKNDDVYSVINIFNQKKNKNMLRWAVMPYIHALSQAVNQ